VATSQALQVLIGEIQALRLEVAELKQGRELEKENPAEVENHGSVVRLALWIEQRFKGN
jgi:hypothetical protein